MKEGIQSFFLSAGNNGCYCFCIIKLAERILKQNIDAHTALQSVVDKKYIRVNESRYSKDDNFYVLKPDSFLSFLSGWKCGVKKETPDYKPKDGEFVVECWQSGKYRHFKLPDWDSLENSQVVKYGKIVSLRVFYPL